MEQMLNRRNGPKKESSTLANLSRDQRLLTTSLTTLTEAENTEYRQFVSDSNGGVFTFLNETSCLQPIKDEKQAKIARNTCLDKTLPGKGEQFSFRKKDYVSLGHADLGLKGDWFFGFGFVTQTILTDLGDVPISDVNLVREELRYLVGFAPAATFVEANKQRAELENGVSQNNGLFFNAVKAVANHTYVLRSIAYRGELLTVINLGEAKIKFDVLKDDKRGDVIVVFRVLGKDENGNTRIIWRKLQMVESHKLELPVSEIDGTKVPKIVTIID